VLPFDGSALDSRILREIEWQEERLPKGITVTGGKMRIGLLHGEKVILKRLSNPGYAWAQTAADALKPCFELPAMGVHPIILHREGAVLLRYHANRGDLVTLPPTVWWPWAWPLLLRIAAYEGVVRSGDRHLGNIMLLANRDELMPVDEVRAFLPLGRFKGARWLRQFLEVGLLEDEWAAWRLRTAPLRTRAAFAKLLEPFPQFAREAQVMSDRAERLDEYTRLAIAWGASE
jgi:hypothetical protein